MSNIRFWYDWSQWLVVPFMVLFAVTCLITHATMQINFDDRIGSTLLFFGIPVVSLTDQASKHILSKAGED